MKRLVVSFFAAALMASSAQAIPLANPDDARSWQGANVGTFANLLYGSNTLANRQAIIANNLLDDGIFNTTAVGTGLYYGNNLGCSGYSTLGGGYGYSCGNEPLATYTARANNLDWQWVQDLGDGGTSWTQGNVWDLGGLANQAVVFPIIDHGPLPQEAIEYSVYLSNNQYATTTGTDGSTQWVLAELDKVYLEGWNSTEVADGFTTVWRLPNDQEFRYVNVFAGGPGSLIHDGDDEIDTVAGLHADNTPSNPTNQVPEPSTLLLLGSGLVGLAFARRKKSV